MTTSTDRQMNFRDDLARGARRVSSGRCLSVKTSDGVPLSGLEYGSGEAAAAIVFGHGFTGTQRNPKVVELARHLAGSRLAVYTADFRGHGASGGRSTLGEREVNDLEALVDYARQRHRWVVSVGASMGAFVALRHAGLGGDVDGVVAISTPGAGRVPKLPRARLLDRVVRSERGRRLLEHQGTRVDPSASDGTVVPIDCAERIAPVPVTIVHGGRDRYVPLADAYALFERLGEPRRLVVLPEFGHGEASFSPRFSAIVENLILDLLSRRSPKPASNGERPSR